MDWTTKSAAESGQGSRDPVAHSPVPYSPETVAGRHEPPRAADKGEVERGQQREIKVGKTTVLTEEHGKETRIEVFTITLGEETVPLLPLRSWSQLDTYKWTVRGRLPGTPAGLDVTHDHVKLTGETVSLKDPEGCAALEMLFHEWLVMEKNTLELARKKLQAHPSPVAPQGTRQTEQQRIHFQVQVARGGQVHINCFQGKELASSIGLNLPGFSGLVSQGLMTKPHAIKVGVLHDWVELDGVLCSFEKGNDDAAKLEHLLNERYVPSVALGAGKEVVIFANAASSTGFDIQFPVTVGGVTEFRKRPLNEESLEILQDRTRCGLLQEGIIIKLARPNLIFKQKTADGGEQYLERSEANKVVVRDDDGAVKSIDLAQPVNCLRLGSVELTAIFNHPSINRHSRTSVPEARTSQTQPSPHPAEAPPRSPPVLTILPPPEQVVESDADTIKSEPPRERPSATPPASEEHETAAINGPSTEPKLAEQARTESEPVKPLPNGWLAPILSQTPIRYDWFACLVYTQLARRIGNSREGKLGLSSCWAAALGETTEVSDPEFKGIFLTEKGGLGFIDHGHMARFHNGVVFIGTQDSALEGIGVTLLGVGMDERERIVFIVTNDYRAKFGVPEETLTAELERTSQSGAAVMSAEEVLASREPIEVVWSVPAQQENPGDPQAIESVKPSTNNASASA